MANKGKESLIPANKRSLSEVRENGRKGGIASGKKRRENKGTVPGYKRKVEENQERSENRQTDTKAGI